MVRLQKAVLLGCLLAAATRPSESRRLGGGLRRSRRSVVTAGGKFADLEECEEAYEKLWDERKPSSITIEPTYEDEGPAPAPAPRKASREIGAPEKKEAQKTFHPPQSDTGVPDSKKGWDYNKHGEDWENSWGECAGPGQSPVDVAKYVDIQGQTKYLLWFDYYQDPDLTDKTSALLSNAGHGIYFEKRPGMDLGFVKIWKREYEVSTYIFHAPSEHTMDGAQFPLELQIYNKPRDGGDGMVAVSIFFKEGESNEFLKSLKEASGQDGAPVWNTQTGKASITLSGKHPGAFDLEAVIPKGDVHPGGDLTWYNYEGSLTQPPCTRGVDWWILSRPVTATREEVKFIRRAIYGSESSRHGNARDAQPLGDRKIHVAMTGFQHAVKNHGHQIASKQLADERQEARGYNSQDLPWGDHWNAEDSPAPAPAN